jgi:hypothetical protein
MSSHVDSRTHTENQRLVGTQPVEEDSPDAGFAKALARCQPHRAMHVPALMVARSHEGLLACG